ncbi:MAG: ATP-binding protein [Acidobacteria bacterium]|nr:ATP-binding protein [Acidobacteriota bacterium]MBI3470355.1 ATP-binding protein [Candidatus Solibacter usitatus]
MSQVFTPATPVREADLFAGRIEQIRRVVDAINQDGQHAVIFGERGVGKTSLSNIIATKLRAGGRADVSAPDALAPKVTCESSDTFASLWRKVLSEIDLIKKKAAIGFHMTVFEETKTAAEVVGDEPTPDDIRRLLTLIGGDRLVYIVIDEFDRLVEPATKRAVADTIKTFSDHAVPTTIIVVGVSDSVDALIAEHESIERCLVQIPMPRMSPDESAQILTTGGKKLKIVFSPDAVNQIVGLSQGLPHYTHLLALHAVRSCIDRKGEEVTSDDVNVAVKKAVENAQQSLKATYYKAVTSPRKDALHGNVLLACALAEPDQFGYFAAGDVREPLSRIMGREYDFAGYAKHLREFGGTERGEVLLRTGVKHKFRFRFRNPLMQPHVIMQGLVDKRIDQVTLQEIIGHRGV